MSGACTLELTMPFPDESTWNLKFFRHYSTIVEGLRRPDALAKATEELDRVGGGERHITEGDIATLPYLEAVVKETMRLHPLSCEDVAAAGGHDIPTGTLVFDAAAFRPERFAESSVDGHAAVHRRRTQRPHPSPLPRCHLTLEDKAFESASAAAAPLPADGSPDDDWFTLLAASLPARTAEEMQRHYEALVEDVTAIQTGRETPSATPPPHRWLPPRRSTTGKKVGIIAKNGRAAPRWSTRARDQVLSYGISISHSRTADSKPGHRLIWWPTPVQQRISRCAPSAPLGHGLELDLEDHRLIRWATIWPRAPTASVDPADPADRDRMRRCPCLLRKENRAPTDSFTAPVNTELQRKGIPWTEEEHKSVANLAQVTHSPPRSTGRRRRSPAQHLLWVEEGGLLHLPAPLGDKGPLKQKEAEALAEATLVGGKVAEDRDVGRCGGAMSDTKVYQLLKQRSTRYERKLANNAGSAYLSLSPRDAKEHQRECIAQPQTRTIILRQAVPEPRLPAHLYAGP
ncbi:hypothetical protein HU200_028173 [Digitaria exilis]|uniref:Myb-like domain-containing protein n=1 Tax=Digitaria exilis TaxID=1010633 RepID=A0A835BT13_9POAL|nr:hypothetical protein HU200_028173 [Digitaria exilis]